MTAVLLLTGAGVGADAIPDRVKLGRLSLADGLSQSAVTSIIQDPRGFLWLGTTDGLNKYDGYNVVVYRHDSDDLASLSDNRIQALLIDPDGRLWIGTSGGLNRYDPARDRFVRYRHDPKATASLGHDDVRTLATSTYEGRTHLWVGTAKGLDRLDPKMGTFVHHVPEPGHPDRLHRAPVNTLAVDTTRGPSPTLWVGTENGLHHLDLADGGRSGRFVAVELAATDPVRPVAIDVRTVLVDRGGRLWVATFGSGLFLLPPGRSPEGGGFVAHRNDPADAASLANDTVRPVLEDAAGQIWVGTSGGLCRVRADDPRPDGTVRFDCRASRPNDPSSLAADDVWALFEDRWGTLWIGTYGGGASTYSPHRHRFAHQAHDPQRPDSLGFDMVMAFAMAGDPDRPALWLGTGGQGLYHLDPDRNRYLGFLPDRNEPGSLSGSGVAVLRTVPLPEGEALFVGTGHGLDRIDLDATGTPVLGRFVAIDLESKPSSPGISAFLVEPATMEAGAVLWVGLGNDGLRRLHLGDAAQVRAIDLFRHDASRADTLSSDRVTALARAPRPGAPIWVATQNGLNVLDPERGVVRRFPRDAEDPHALSHGMIMSLLVDRGGTLWVGTAAGLNRLEGTATSPALVHQRQPVRFTRYTDKQGLPNVTIYCMAQDRSGDLWLSTNHGLARMDLASETFRNYNIADGLQSYEFNAGACLHTPGDTLYFGGIGGYNRFRPEDIEGEARPPHVVLTDLKLFNRSVPIGIDDGRGRPVLTSAIGETEHITLSDRDDVVTFEFAALHSTDPTRNRYAYRLEGFDEDWNEVGFRRFATYTNLPAGTYTFRVKAANANGVWNHEGAVLGLEIEPPWWRAPWFLALFSSTIVGLVFAAHRYRLRLLRIRTHDLTVQVDAHTTELRQSNARLQHEIVERERSETERARLERQMQHSQKLESLGVLAGGIAHDFNNLLTSILGNAELMGQHLSEDARPRIANIEQAALRAAELCQQLLAYSGKGRFLIHAVDLNSLVLEMTDLLDVGISKKVTLEHRLAASLPPVEGDATQLRQVVMNLVSNASDALGDHAGTIVLRTGLETVTREALVRDYLSAERNGGTFVVLEVADDGCGMDEATVARIFDPFFSTKFTGRGLGLAATLGIVHGHRGAVAIDTAPGHGTTFRVLLPRASDTLDEAAGVPTESTESTEDDWHSTGTALVVDDEPAAREVGRAMMERLGFDTVLAADGDEALAWFEEGPQRATIVLLDVTMPKRDGTETLRAMRALRPDVPVILSSGYNEQALAERLGDRGDAAFLEKPYRFSALRQLVRQVLDA